MPATLGGMLLCMIALAPPGSRAAHLTFHTVHAEPGRGAQLAFELAGAPSNAAALQFDLFLPTNLFTVEPAPAGSGPFSLSVAPLSPETHRIVIDTPGNLALGTNPLAALPIRLRSNAAAQPALPRAAALLVSDHASHPIPAGIAPTVGLSELAPTGQLSSPLTLTALADDSDGSVARVEFFANALLIAEDTSAPFEIASFVPTQSGPLTLSAVAIDNDGLRSHPATRAVLIAGGTTSGTTSTTGGSSGASGTTTGVGGTSSAGTTTSSSSSGGATGSGGSTGDSTTGSGGSTTAGTGATGSTTGAGSATNALTLLPWKIVLKKPRPDASVRFIAGKRGLATIRGLVTETGLPRKSGAVRVQLALTPDRWQDATKISKVGRRGSALFVSKRFAADSLLTSGAPLTIHIRASTNFNLATTETNRLSVRIR